MTNIITACFGGTRYANTRPAWLIDHGMVLQIKGVELPESYFVDFANSKAEQATRVLGNADGVVIPDQYFLSNAPQIFAWVYLTTGDSGFTTLQITIPLSQRPDVTDEPPTPQETSLIEQAIAALNDGVERAETAADDAEAAVANIQQTVNDALQTAKDSGEFDGTDGVNGVTFTPDVDAAGNISWTNDGGLPNPQTRNIKGPAGKDGEVGATPNLTIGTVETLEPGEDATAEITGTAENPVLNLGIPQGEQGDSADTSNLAPVIINSASGDIASFADGADNMPVKQLTVNVEPIQAGSGDPSPDNVRPISGRTSATVTRTGRNLFDKNAATTEKFINARGQEIANSSKSHSELIPVKPSTAYFMNGFGNSGFFAILAVDANKQPITWYGGASKDAPFTATTPSNCRYVYLNFNADQIDTMAFYEGNTNEGYIPYQGNTYTIQLGDTVYGGTLDVTSGKMVVDRAMVDLGTLAWGYESSTAQFYSNGISSTSINWHTWSAVPPLLCSQYKPISNAQLASSDFCVGYAYNSKQLRVKDSTYTDAATFKTAMSGVQLVYELATPIEITLTPTQIETLLGTNHIWSDASSVDVEYRADTKLYIDNIHTPTDDDMTADAQIASGKFFLIGGTLYKSTTVIPAGDTIIPGTNCIKTNLAEALNALNA